MSIPPRTSPRALLATAVTSLLLCLGLAPAVPAAAADPGPAPGDFTGLGFDQCLAPEQWKMDRWLETSPFLAVGIYVSGDSRGCRSQPNLTRKWVRIQQRKGWRLLPITLGPQASCQPSFPRYGDDEAIDPRPGRRGGYRAARRMGRAEARSSAADAAGLGIAKGSTLWYDLEAYTSSDTDCRESALSFLSGWTAQLHTLGWVSGVYSSAGSGIKDLDDARVSRPSAFAQPDQIWVARWDGVANTSTSYLREDGWRPGGRVKQFQGGHDETWGGVTINIDRDYLDLGRGSFAPVEDRCDGTRLNFRSWAPLRAPSDDQTPAAGRLAAAQCLLSERGVYDGAVTGRWNRATGEAVRAWRAERGFVDSESVGVKIWTSLHAAGSRPVLKTGSAGSDVRRVQRALAATTGDARRPRGVYSESPGRRRARLAARERAERDRDRDPRRLGPAPARRTLTGRTDLRRRWPRRAR